MHLATRLNCLEKEHNFVDITIFGGEGVINKRTETELKKILE